MNILHKKITEISDEDLEKDIGDVGIGTNIQLAGLMELNRRYVKYLKKSIDKFSNDSEKSSKKMITLTACLIGLTVILIFITIILAAPVIKDTFFSK